MKLSQWHKGNVKPVHVGVYQCAKDDLRCFSYWDGEHFNGQWFSVGNAYNSRDFYTLFPDGCSIVTEWRGIVK